MTRPRPAFTLLELLIVVTILAVLATLTTAALMPARLSAQRNAVRSDFARLTALCEQYKALHGRYPLYLRDVTDQLTDPWGTPYLYFVRPTKVRETSGGLYPVRVTDPMFGHRDLRFHNLLFVSAGPDKRFAARDPLGFINAPGADDLCNWRE